MPPISTRVQLLLLVIRLLVSHPQPLRLSLSCWEQLSLSEGNWLTIWRPKTPPRPSPQVTIQRFTWRIPPHPPLHHPVKKYPKACKYINILIAIKPDCLCVMGPFLRRDVLYELRKVQHAAIIIKELTGVCFMMAGAQGQNFRKDALFG